MSFLTSHDRTQLRSVCRSPAVANKLIRGVIGDGVYSLTLTGNTTLTKATHFKYRVMRLDPGGAARTLTLPTEAEMEGFLGIISNGADEDEALTIKEDAGSTTIATVEQNEAVLIGCDGTDWFAVKLVHSGST